VRRARSGRGRRQLGDAAGDPLDGLVNLFDLGIVLAVAFLIAGLAAGSTRVRDQQRKQAQQVPSPSQAAPAQGRGKAVGTVYRLSDGRLIYTRPGGAAP
jgi:hypothetical protein